MSRWAPDAAGRLKAAALQLFAERGFAAVKGADIAAAAGVSERTFFRHYKAKEDVLFEDYLGLRAALRARVEAAPPGASARAILQSLADDLSAAFAESRAAHRALREVVAREPRLRAREALRDRDWAEAIAEGFVARGAAPSAARALADAFASTYRLAHEAWLDDASTTPGVRFAEALAALARALG